MAAAATQLVFEPRLEGIITALLSSSSPVELITLPLSSLNLLPGVRWAHLRLQLAQTTGEIALGFRRVSNGDPLVVLNPDSGLTMEVNDEVVILSKCDQSQTATRVS
jgi:hypothetical protein